MSVKIEWNPTVLANTGCQYRFLPLFQKDCKDGNVISLNGTLWDETATFKKNHDDISKVAKLCEDLEDHCLREKSWRKLSKDFLKFRFAIKKIGSVVIVGLELAIETTRSPNGYENVGLCVRTESVPKSEKNAKQFLSVYHNVPDGTNYQISDSVTFPRESAETDNRIEIVITIGFRRRIVQENALGAHLIIDVGNSRTCALLLKDEANQILSNIESFRSCCKPVLLGLDVKNNAVTHRDLTRVDEGIVSSWIILHQTQFDEDCDQIFQRRYATDTISTGCLFFKKSETINTRKEYRIPLMFVQGSPVVFGTEAKDLLSLSDVKSHLMDRGLQIQQSSPKRYFASQEKSKKAWSMIPNTFTQEGDLNANLLRGDILRYMDENGKYVDASNVPEAYRPVKNPINPNYPRRSTLIWMIIAILERAWDQCNRFVGNNEMYTPYQIKDVTITFPSGWTYDEITQYRQVCKEAVSIFEKMNFFTDGNIKVLMNIDEAVASQLPFIFSEINKYQNNAIGWMRFAGKIREDKSTVRVLNYDIGGGTSDISVVEYQCLDDGNINSVTLQPRLLFKDGHSQAGDELLRQIIGRIILPQLDTFDSITQNIVSHYFTGMPTNDDECIARSSFLKLCIIPIGIKILSELTSGTASGRITPDQCGVGYGDWKRFHEKLNLIRDSDQWWSIQITYDVTEINRIIKDYFQNSFDHVSRIASEYDADVFFMSGKTSELPTLKELALEKIPLTNDRILSAKNYRPGDWYPFVKTNEHGVVEDNSIFDAKSITAVGAALGYLLSNSRVPGWHLKEMINDITTRSEWGTAIEFQRPNGRPFEFDHEDCASVFLSVNQIIVRRMMHDTNSTAVYKIVSKHQNRTGYGNLNVLLQRFLDEQTNLESLKLCSVLENGVDCTNDFELVVCQGDECFWQDSGRVI